MGNANYDIFISYRQRYIVWVESLYINLIEQGYRVFLDNHSLPQGRPLEDSLYKHIDEVKHFIVVATNDIDVEDSWVLKECRYAEKLQQQGKAISLHTMSFDSEVPHLFSEVHLHIDFSSPKEDDYRANFLQLCESFKGRKSSPFAKFEGWLDIPKQCIYNLKSFDRKFSFTLVQDRGLLAEVISTLKHVADLNLLKKDEVERLHTVLVSLYQCKEKNVSRQSLLLLCMLHHGYSALDFAQMKLAKLNVKKISALIRANQDITDLDRERLQDISLHPDKKMICKVGK